MICRTDTGAETVKLVDFGIAKIFGEQATETQQLTKSGAVTGWGSIDGGKLLKVIKAKGT
jgi:hypothetical protein